MKLDTMHIHVLYSLACLNTKHGAHVILKACEPLVRSFHLSSEIPFVWSFYLSDDRPFVFLMFFKFLFSSLIFPGTAFLF